MKHNISATLWMVMATLAMTPSATYAQKGVTEAGMRSTELNTLCNPQYNAINPVRLTHNAVKDAAEGRVDYHWLSGDLHRVDEPSLQRDFGLNIEGLHQIGFFHLEGHLGYRRISKYNMKWNSTLYLPQDNVFVLGDTVSSDQTIEQFNVGMTAAMEINQRLQLGLLANLLVGTMADQTDPRPKTDATQITLTPGVEWKATKTLSLGAAVNIDIYRSSIVHTIINTQKSHRYLLMKGLGDYFLKSSSTQGSYPRDYSGETYRIAAHANIAPANATWQDWVEVTYGMGSEDALDGGSSYTFRGGDFKRSLIGLKNVWLMRTPTRTHRISLGVQSSSGEGVWYDQKAKTDKAHANMTYYEILSKDKIYTSSRLAADLSYTFATMRNDMPEWKMTVGARGESTEEKSMSYDIAKQQYTTLTGYASVGRHIKCGRCTLGFGLEGAFRTAIGTPKYADTNNDIVSKFTIPEFAYKTAKTFTGALHAEAMMPMPSSKVGLRLFVDANYTRYLGSDERTEIFKGTSLTNLEAGVAINFWHN